MKVVSYELEQTVKVVSYKLKCGGRGFLYIIAAGGSGFLYTGSGSGFLQTSVCLRMNLGQGLKPWVIFGERMATWAKVAAQVEVGTYRKAIRMQKCMFFMRTSVSSQAKYVFAFNFGLQNYLGGLQATLGRAWCG